jgi:RNA recognition motif-containing protein
MATMECEIPKSGSARACEDEESAPDWCHPAKLFIGGLPRQTSTQQLRDHFSKHGRVVDCVVMRWSDGRSRGFGYITYDSAESANEVLKAPQTLDGRVVDVKRAVPGTNKLFVGGLPQGVTAAELRTYFSNFGPVSDAVVMMDSATGRSRGFGFVCFAPGPEGATAINGALSNYEQHQLRGKWIEVKSAAPPQELAKGCANAPSELVLPPSTPSSLQSAPMTPAMSQYSPCQTLLGYNSLNSLVSSPHSLLHNRHQLPFMSPNAPEFVPTGDDLVYNHMMQADGYAQEHLNVPLHPPYPGGRPPATPHSDRSLIQADLQKPEDHLNHFAMPTIDQRAFAAVRSMEHEESMPPLPPPPQHAPSEPHWPLFASESLEASRVPAAHPNLPGDAAAGFARATGFFATDNEGAATPKISPPLTVARPPPGLEDEAANIMAGAATPLCVEVAPEMQDASTQTEGPACRACGASFGCAGKCPWSRNQLLNLRQAFLRTKVEPKDASALKAVRHGDGVSSRKKNYGGA